MIWIKTSDLISLLREKGKKVTPQRLAICQEVFSRDDHPSVEQIYLNLKNKYPTISLATIYKTLQLLKEKGYLQEVGTSNGSVRYDPNRNLHVNLVCTKCGEITDVIPKTLPQMWSVLTSDLGIEPQSQLLNIYYTCKKCGKIGIIPNV
ncbi:MAG: Peroxide-responsive repressor perR [Promethearchaeota archaeon CR_4]|nr:MAG: Peroxide-responsive repressor perR [Candidatus Lokiarchaeota archaeon CR_4]